MTKLNLKSKLSLKSAIFGAMMIGGFMIGTNEVFGAVKQDNSMDDPLITLENAYNTSKLVKGGLQEKDFEIFEKLLASTGEMQKKINKDAKDHGRSELYNFLLMLRTFLGAKIKIGNTYQTVGDMLIQSSKYDGSGKHIGFSPEQINSFLDSHKNKIEGKYGEYFRKHGDFRIMMHNSISWSYIGVTDKDDTSFKNSLSLGGLMPEGTIQVTFSGINFYIRKDSQGKGYIMQKERYPKH